jgi:putative transposase
MRTSYKVYENEAMYFVTSSIIEWVPIFTSKVYFDILVNSLNFCTQNKDLKIFSWVVLDNHFHLVCQAPELSKTLQSLKRHTAKEILAQLELDNKDWILNLFAFYKKRHKIESHHQIWQEGFHPKMVISDDMLTQKIEYMHYNPVKRGYVERAEDWLHSSAGYYSTGKESLVSITPLELFL